MWNNKAVRGFFPLSFQKEGTSHKYLVVLNFQVSSFDSTADASSHQHHGLYFVRKHIKDCKKKKIGKLYRNTEWLPAPVLFTPKLLISHSLRERRAQRFVIRFWNSLLSLLSPPTKLLLFKFNFYSFSFFLSFIRLEITVFLLFKFNIPEGRGNSIQLSVFYTPAKCLRSPGFLKHSTVPNCV